MSDKFSVDRGNGVSDPLLRSPLPINRFSAYIDYTPYFYTAAYHRPLVRSLTLVNERWNPSADEIQIYVFVKSASGADLIRPFACAFKSPQIGDRIVVEAIQIKPNLPVVVQINDAETAELVIQVQDDEEVLAEHRNPIDFLAYNQWMHQQFDYDCLAAFVMPDHPVIANIMEGVRARLLESTGSGTTEGYQMLSVSRQANLKRVIEIVQAIFEELQFRDYEYSNPPASFEGYGQMIRTPDVVEQQKILTCLDSSILFASCLAAAGLSPLIFVVRGHAFPGVLVEPGDPLRESVQTNQNVFDMMAQSEIISVESTLICRSLASDFESAVNRHVDFSNGASPGAFRALVDIERCIETGVRRLPARLMNVDSGNIEVLEAPSGNWFDRRIDTSPTSPTESEFGKLVDNDTPQRVRRWMDALLDISNTNALINLKTRSIETLAIDTPAFDAEKGRLRLTLKSKTAARAGVRLPLSRGMLATVEDRVSAGLALNLRLVQNLPNHLLPTPSVDSLVDTLKQSGQLSVADIGDFFSQIDALKQSLSQQFGLPPQQAASIAFDGVADLFERESSKRFRGLKTLANEVESSSGTNQLYLTLGTLVWTPPAEQGKQAVQVRSPLFFIPVRLKGSISTSLSVEPESDTGVSPNYCLLEKLRFELGLKFEALETPDLDESGIDIDKAIRSIREQLGKTKFSSMTIEEDCSLAVLDFANFRIWNDIKTNWRLFTKNIVVDHLIHGQHRSLEQDVAPFEGEILTPFDCDESQLEAITWSLEGRSFVLEGPPGTGKSQTIANMVAANVTQGRRVLFVAEKKVALEAVSKKLEVIGLTPFCITMHHESTTTNSVREQLQQSLKFTPTDQSTQWENDSAKLNSVTRRLNQYRESLVSTNPVNQSAMSALREVQRLGPGHSVDVKPQSLSALSENLPAIRSALLDLPSAAGGSRCRIDRAWFLSGLVSVEEVDKVKLSEAFDRISRLLPQCSHLDSVLEPLLQPTSSPVSGDLGKIFELASSGFFRDTSTIRTCADPKWKMSVARAIQGINAVKNEFAPVLRFFKPSALSTDVSIQMAAALDAVSAGVFKKKKSTEKLYSLVGPLAQHPVVETPAEVLTLLQQLAPLSQRVSSIRTELASIQGLNIPFDFDPMDDHKVEELSRDVDKIAENCRLLASPPADAVRSMLDSGLQFTPADSALVTDFSTAWVSVTTQLKVSPESFGRWLNGDSPWVAMSNSSPVWKADAPLFNALSSWCRMSQAVQPLLDANQQDLVDRILKGEQDLDSLYEAFMRGIAHASLEERLQWDALQSFDRSIFDRAIGDFIRLDGSLKALMGSVIPARLFSSRPFRPGKVTSEIGSLNQELGKKVNKVSLPKLMKQHGEAVTSLTPCFLMSPEAVSRLLPADSQFFDLVIFDEASQVRVASAIPSMGRGKAVIVVGDSQQMPPSKKIGTKSSAGGEDDEDVVQDLESILVECRESNLPSHMLTCHFRSEHEALIAFSNRNFYGGDLITFPAPNSTKTSPVHWFDVPDGQFHRSGDSKQTNPNEAQAIVDEIVRRLNDPAHSSKSIGVVTFNEPQTDLIFQELSEVAKSNPKLRRVMGDETPVADRLFVVPLERVQGDERDTIIISVNYSYQDNERSKVPTNWGPLTNQGGERRLNVAITRAKKDLLVFCSFDPDHVDIKGSTHRGVPATVEFLKEVRDSSRSGTSQLGARAIASRDELRQALFDQLRDKGVHVRQNVGLSKFRVDISVSDDQGHEFLALIIDSPDWASRSTAFDREALPNSVLHRIGWRRLGRVFTKSVALDPSLPIRLVEAELKREAFRKALIAEFESMDYVVREDSQLSQLGIDFAAKKRDQSSYPLAVCLSVPDTFTQFVPYEGEKPPRELLEDLDIVGAVVVRPAEWSWTVGENVVRSIVDALEDNSKELDRRAIREQPEQSTTRQPETLAGVSQPKAETIAPETQITYQSGLSASPHVEPFESGGILPLLGTKANLGPGPDTREDLIRRAIFEIVELEGPIGEGRLASFTARRFDMTRVEASRLESLRSFFSAHTVSTGPNGVVYWPTHRKPGEWLGFRPSDKAERGIREVPAEEIANAFVALLGLRGLVSLDDALREVGGIFGVRALTEQVKEYLTGIVAWAAGRELLRVSGQDLLAHKRD